MYILINYLNYDGYTEEDEDEERIPLFNMGNEAIYSNYVLDIIDNLVGIKVAKKLFDFEFNDNKYITSNI